MVKGAMPRPKEPPESFEWCVPLALFFATTLSTFYVGAGHALQRTPWELFEQHRRAGLGTGLRAFGLALAQGKTFALPLLGILLCHELAHLLMARRHGVRAGLPMFIPAPNLFGTLGAFVTLKGRVETRDALVDISAAGPLAGLALALPITVVGLWLSHVEPAVGRAGLVLEGDSLLYLALKRVVCGPVPEGYGVRLHPIAFAGWTGLFITMMNLLPIGSLDGGRIAYAVFGVHHEHRSRGIIAAFVVFAALVAGWIRWRAPDADFVSGAYAPALLWALWAILAYGVLQRPGSRHPPTNDEPLSPSRRRIAAATFVCLLLLFMPLPLQIT